MVWFLLGSGYKQCIKSCTFFLTFSLSSFSDHKRCVSNSHLFLREYAKGLQNHTVFYHYQLFNLPHIYLWETVKMILRFHFQTTSFGFYLFCIDFVNNLVVIFLTGKTGSNMIMIAFFGSDTMVDIFKFISKGYGILHSMWWSLTCYLEY